MNSRAIFFDAFGDSDVDWDDEPEARNSESLVVQEQGRPIIPRAVPNKGE